MRRSFKAALVLAGLTLSVAVAVAAPHFLSASASQSGDNLVVSFREAGLGNTDITVQATADATAVYACINGGGKNPSAANKRTINTAVSASGVFSPKNGSVRGSLTLTNPGPGDFTCTPGQRLTLVSVTYTNVRVTDVTNNVSVAIQ